METERENVQPQVQSVRKRFSFQL